jgi:hypothetical protein
MTWRWLLGERPDATPEAACEARCLTVHLVGQVVKGRLMRAGKVAALELTIQVSFLAASMATDDTTTDVP